VDRYFPNGRIKQVLLSPREIDVTQLSAEASQSWINPRFIYTHGFGAVLSEVNKITPDGLPVLLIENAPPESKLQASSSPGRKFITARRRRILCSSTPSREFDYPSATITIFDLSGDRRLPYRIHFSEGCRSGLPR